MVTRVKYTQTLLVTLVLLGGFACTQTDSSHPTESIAAFAYPLSMREPIYENPVSGHEIGSLDWNPKGDSIAIGAWLDAFVYRLDDDSLHEIRHGLAFSQQVAWSPDGLLLAGGGNMLWVWASDESKMVFEVETSGSLTGYGRVFWHPNSDVVAATLYTDTSQIQIADLGRDTLTDYDVQSARSTKVLGWSPDGKYLAVGNDNVHIVDYATQSTTTSYQREMADDSPLAWNPDSNMVVFQTLNKEIVVGDVSNGRILASLSAYPGRVFDLKWHPQNPYVAIAGENGVWIWNVEADAANIVQNERAFAVDWSPDAEQLVTHVETEMKIYEITELP